MSERKSIGRALAAHFTRVRASAGRIVAGAIALSALRLVSLMDAPSATASYAVALAFGGLLLIGALAVKRGSQEPHKCLAESRRARVRPPRFR
jgi:hypothetical protein